MKSMNEVKKDSRGGVRTGAGRKSTGREYVNITLYMPAETADMLRSLAKEKGIPLWKVIQEAIRTQEAYISPDNVNCRGLLQKRVNWPSLLASFSSSRIHFIKVRYSM